MVKEGEQSVSLDLLREKMVDFAKERGWGHFHSPRNLLLALLQVGEVGELSEIFQWKGEVARGLPDWKDEERIHLGEELSDVLLYLVQLSDTCCIDLGKAALRKIQLNAQKYPPNPCNNLSLKTEEEAAAARVFEDDDDGDDDRAAAGQEVGKGV